MQSCQAVVKATDMSDDMQQLAVDCAYAAITKYTHERDISAYIKKEFDKRFHCSWHCIVGQDFGSYVTHDSTHFIFFFMGKVGVLLWRTAPTSDGKPGLHPEGNLDNNTSTSTSSSTTSSSTSSSSSSSSSSSPIPTTYAGPVS